MSKIIITCKYVRSDWNYLRNELAMNPDLEQQKEDSAV